MTGAIHPWRRFRAHEGWRLVRHDGGERGVTLFAERKVSLRRGLTQVQRRCTILHECLHVERGPVLNGMLEAEELRVRRETARLLMPDIRVVGDSLAWAQSNEEAAHELWVTPDCLADRLGALHPVERHWLRRRLAVLSQDVVDTSPRF